MSVYPPSRDAISRGAPLPRPPPEFAPRLGGSPLRDAAPSLGGRPSLSLEIDVTNDPPLQNVYSVIPVSPARHPGVNAPGALAFAKWIVGARGQGIIGNYTVGSERPFHPEGLDGC